MFKSRARLAADWFAKLRQNELTQEVEHTDVQEAEQAATEVAESIDLSAYATNADVDSAIANIDFSSGADYISGWFNVYSDNNYTITHNLGTSNVFALIQIQGLGNGYHILSPSMSYPYYDINKPSGISTWTTSTQVKMRTGRGLFFYRAQSSHTGYGVSYENYSNDPMSIRVLVWKI